MSVTVPRGLRSVFKTLCRFMFMTNCYGDYCAHIVSVCIIQKIQIEIWQYPSLSFLIARKKKSYYICWSTVSVEPLFWVLSQRLHSTRKEYYLLLTQPPNLVLCLFQKATYIVEGEIHRKLKKKRKLFLF